MKNELDLRRKLAQKSKERLIAQRNALGMQDALLEAQMLRLRGKVQRKRIKKTVDEFLRRNIELNKARGRNTKTLEQRLANSEKIVEKIMQLPKSVGARNAQKSLLKEMGIYGSSVILGAIAVSKAMDYKEKRMMIDELRKSNERRIKIIDSQIKRI